MANKHMNIRRIVHRSVEEIRASLIIARQTSFLSALHTFMMKIQIQIMNRNGHKETEKIKKNLLKKHEIMNEYFEKTFSYFIQSYQFDESTLVTDSPFKNCIWVCWWQGMEQSPEIVGKCVDSLRKHAKEHQVVLVTEDNFRDYADIPEWLIQKRKDGIITRTHFSDVLRMYLLAKHGGLWLDATFFCCSPEINEYFDLPIWSVKRPDYGHISVACGGFMNGTLGCNFANRKVFAIIRDFLTEYWQRNNIMIDYLFLDYLIALVRRHYADIEELFEHISPNNDNSDELVKVLDQPFCPQLWKQLQKNTALFTLTWKRSFLKEMNGQQTFYGKLVDGTL